MGGEEAEGFVAGQMRSGIDGNALTAAIARCYKFLIPQYTEEFAAQLRQHVIAQTSPACFVQASPPAAHLRPDFRILQLYGEHIIPQEIRDLFNMSLFEWRHASEARLSCEELRGRIFTTLYKHILWQEEKPIITRFWLFGVCANRLLLAQLLGIPHRIFSTQLLQMQPKNQTRLNAFVSWYRDTAQQQDLRRACLCLRLTSLATSCTAKFSGGQATPASQTPTLVELGQGLVQRRTPSGCINVRQFEDQLQPKNQPLDSTP